MSLNLVANQTKYLLKVSVRRYAHISHVPEEIA